MPHCEAPERDPAGRPRSWLDGFAICASALCTVHCLGLPLLFALLPTIAARIDPGVKECGGASLSVEVIGAR